MVKYALPAPLIFGALIFGCAPRDDRPADISGVTPGQTAGAGLHQGYDRGDTIDPQGASAGTTGRPTGPGTPPPAVEGEGR
jgi:hypothetical protein